MPVMQNPYVNPRKKQKTSFTEVEKQVSTMFAGHRWDTEAYGRPSIPNLSNSGVFSPGMNSASPQVAGVRYSFANTSANKVEVSPCVETPVYAAKKQSKQVSCPTDTQTEEESQSLASSDEELQKTPDNNKKRRRVRFVKSQAPKEKKIVSATSSGVMVSFELPQDALKALVDKVAVLASREIIKGMFRSQTGGGQNT